MLENKWKDIAPEVPYDFHEKFEETLQQIDKADGEYWNHFLPYKDFHPLFWLSEVLLVILLIQRFRLLLLVFHRHIRQSGCLQMS